MAITYVTYQNQTFHISYDIINYKSKDNIIFLHGWGSNKEIMKNSFATYFTNYKQIYIDMPGFGNSNICFSLTTQDYANIIELFLQKLNISKNIIVGHSFGGKIASLLQPHTLVLLSSAGILEKKKLTVQLKIKLAKILNKIGLQTISKFFRSDDVKQMDEVLYQTFKNVVDEDFSNIFKTIVSKTIIFWGINDKAVSLESGKKIHNLIKNSTFYELPGDHYFFISHTQQIYNIINNNYK